MAQGDATKGKRFSWLLLLGALIIIAALLVGIWLVFFTHKQEPYAVRFIENGYETWYWYHKGKIEPMAEADLARLPAALAIENAFAGVRAEDGSQVALSNEGVIVVSPSGERSVLMERSDLEPGSSTISTDAGAVALFNTTTNAYDLFALDRTRPAILSYLGSIPAPDVMYSLGFAHDSLLLVRTSERDFLWYEFSNEGVRASGPARLKESDSVFGVLQTPVAHAWTYSAKPTATGATTVSGQRCTGAQVATLGTASGSGIMPSVQTTIWSYMPNPNALPANYNNGNHCIQAYTTVTTTGGGGGGGGGGGDGEDTNLLFEHDPHNLLGLLAETAHAQTSSWTVAYTAHSGSGTTADSDYYALTYTPAGVTASLSASPTTIDSGSSALLTWSSLNATSCTGTGFSTGNATSGSVSVAPTATATYSVSCTGAGGTATDSETVEVIYRPNLASSAPTPSSASAGVVTTVTASVTNSGAGTTGAGFFVLFQARLGSGPVTDMGTAATGALASGGSASVSTSWTFPSTGTYYVRTCADMTSAGDGGLITESNEGDNCSSWTTVAVTGIGTGTWVHTDSDISDFWCPLTDMTKGGYNNVADCNPTDPSGMSCSAIGSLCKYKYPSGCSMYVEVYECQGAALSSVSVNLIATPDTINSGESSTLSWTSNGAEVCTSNDFTTGDNILGSFLVSPLETTSYIITCFASAADAAGGGDDFNVPFVMEEWWTGGTSETVYSEWIHNNDFSQFEAGYGIEELCASYAGGFDAWNLQVRDTQRVGDAGTSLMWLTCYGVNDPTGTVAKPSQTHFVPNGDPEYTTFARSESSSGGSAGFAVSSVTVTVETECNDGDDNDGDGTIDENDEGCTGDDDDSESGEVRATLDANPTQVPVNTKSMLEWECAGGATSASISGIGSVSPASGGTVQTANLTNASNNFELTCTSASDTDTDIAVVTTTNPTGNIDANPTRVLKGGESLLEWACYPEATSFSVSGSNGFSASTATGTDIPSDAINTQTTFTLYCDGVAVDTAIVNIDVIIDEF